MFQLKNVIVINKQNTLEHTKLCKLVTARIKNLTLMKKSAISFKSS